MTTPQAAGNGPVPRFAIFTDFDGTLIDLAETPDQIVVPAELTAEIARAAACLGGAIAVISGRALADLERYLPAGIAAAGGHGTERRRADGSRVTADPAYVDAASRIAERLLPLVQAHPELIVERKDAAVALHFRAAPNLEPACRTAMQEAAGAESDFEVLEGKMVVEARPRGTSKAEAIRAFMEESPFAGRIPVFFGDDTTDEDGFRAAQEMGGVGVKIGMGQSVAKVRTEDVASARATIVGLARRVAAATAAQQS